MSADLMLDAAPDAVVISDAQGRIELVNRQTEVLFGYLRAELLGQPVEILVPAASRARHVEQRAAYFREPHTRPMGLGLELQGVRKDGTRFPIEISLSPIPTEGGLLVAAAIRDITDRKKIEDAARLARDRLLSAVESFQDAFALFDAEDRLILCNSAFRRSLPEGMSGGVIGMSFEGLLDALLLDQVFSLGDEPKAAFKARRMAYHAAPGGSFDVRTADGHYWRFIDRRTAEGGTVLTIWDLTDDLRREEELREARGQAEAASAAKSEFLSSVSHELRTPLNAILGFAQLLQRDRRTPLNERQRGMLQHVLKGGEHLLRLIDEILDLSRIETGNVTISTEPVAVPGVLREVRETLSPMAARADVVLEVEVAKDLPHIVADRTRFAQILMNFGSNAIKYGHTGGRVVFVAEPANEGRVRVTVTDTGSGIPFDKQDRLFQPFHRAGQETGPIEGTGIGLTITKRLAEMMNGGVGFVSVPGEGSSFWVELPALGPEALAAVPRSAQVAAGYALADPEGPQLSVLYVEDNPSNLAFMEELMSSFERVRLITAPTAEIGIELARAHRPRLILLDINLPGMSGYEALRCLREDPALRDTPVLALSASAMERDVRRAREAGFSRYLTKPVKVDELLETLDAYLTTERSEDR